MIKCLLLQILWFTVFCQAGQSQLNATRPGNPRAGGFIEGQVNKGERKLKVIKTYDQNIKEGDGKKVNKQFDIKVYQISDKTNGRKEGDSKVKKNKERERNIYKNAENSDNIFKVKESDWKMYKVTDESAKKHGHHKDVTKVYTNKDSKIKVYKDKEKGIKIFQISDLDGGYGGGGKRQGVLGTDCDEGTLIGQHGWWKDVPLMYRSRKSRSPHRQQDSSSSEEDGGRQAPRRRRPLCHDVTGAGKCE